MRSGQGIVCIKVMPIIPGFAITVREDRNFHTHLETV